MITSEQVMEYFRSDYLEELEIHDRYEVMIACCSHSEFLEELVKQAMDAEEIHLQDGY